MTAPHRHVSVRVVVLLLISACACLAAVGNVAVLGTTSTQAVVTYTAPDGKACTIQVSQSAGLTPMALDVDPATFANSNSDLARPSTVTSGRHRTVVIGQRTAQYATAGTYSGVRHFSRALQAFTPYFGQITCPSTGDTATFTFTTGNIPLGGTYGDPWLSDPAHPGDQPWPESLGGLTPESFIDPLTGVLLMRLGLRGNNYGFWNNMPFGSAFNQGQTPCDTVGPWASPCNVTAGTGSTTVGNSTAPLVLRPLLTANNAWNSGYGSSSYTQIWSLDQFAVNLTGLASSTTTSFRVLDACVSLNGGASCASSTQQLTLGQTSSQQTVGQANTSQFGIIPWLLDTNPRFNVQESSPHSGNATVAGNTVTWVSGDNFSLYWVTGGNGRIRLSSNNDACTAPPSATTSNEYTIASFLDGTHLTVSGTPPAGSVYWCANNFAVMLWRDQSPTDGSTVTLTAAKMAALESTAPTYPDNGASTACFNKQIANGWFCMYGGLYWINPTTDAVVYYGYMVASAKDSSGNYILNPWTSVGQIPAGETADIDQTQNNLTFYTVSFDPSGGGPLVIQGVFNPPSISQPTSPYGNGSQIQNASVTSTTPYSVTYNNGLTFTNMTPQVSAAESVVQQMATFDPTFNPSYFNRSPAVGNGWNCSPAAMSTGVFYFFCFSIGGDSPAWLFAFSPGDANPAHAGQPGGPQIVGAINTFNTPNGPVASTQTSITGRDLHGIAETGETGWVAIQANQDSPINTVNASVPATGPQACSFYGLTNNNNDCILLNINSHTAGGVTGIEPYFPAPLAPFSGAPGELRTTQLGDTACVSISTTCPWSSQQSELMTLVVKNYGGTARAWVFQRKSYGSEIAIPAGPLTLTWISNQWSIPPGGTTENGSLASVWNPLTGCAGSPDKHGSCLIQDTNNTSGHGEWRDGGEAVATNVPVWGQPIWGWPTDYQTAVGIVPGIFSLPFANVTPFQAQGVNFTSVNPPFAGVYGHPWGFDAGTHPNAAGANASAYESIRAFDNIPVQGGGGEPSFTPVTGQLYVTTPALVTDPDDFFGSGTLVGINRKLMAQGISCGSHPLIDISGPGAAISTNTSGSYTACFTRANGECYSGSTVGQVYVNCPGVVSTTCAGTSIHGGFPIGPINDICIGNLGIAANAVRQFTLDRTDLYGAYARTLLTATARLRMVYGFENNRMLPDNSWLLLRTDWLNYQRSDMWMAKVPPYPAPDSVNRGTFVPIPVALHPPAGTNNVIVQFGYQEYGAPRSLNCTMRNDPCVTTLTASTVPAGNQPFYFVSENPAGASCASACTTITIPALSQRVLYYQVTYRTASNTVISSDTVSTKVIP